MEAFDAASFRPLVHKPGRRAESALPPAAGRGPQKTPAGLALRNGEAMDQKCLSLFERPNILKVKNNY